MTEFSFDDGDMTPAEVAEAMRDLSSALETRLSTAATDIAQKIAGEARRNAPVDTGDLRSRIQGVVENVSSTLVKIRVGTNRDGAAAQESGTEPGHFPPPSALRGWARRVLGDESAAYPVARSIAESGLDEQPYLRPAFRENVEWALDRINDAVEAAFNDVGIST